MKSRAGLVTVRLLAALAAACIGTSPLPEPRAARAASGWAAISLETPEGRTVSLGDHVGKSPVLLAFWATWCPRCLATVPRLNEIEAGPLRGRVQLLAIDFLESRRKVAAFVRKEKIAYTVLLDGDGGVSRRFRVPGIPTYILLDRAGRIAWRGNALPADLDALLSRAAAG